MTIRSALLFLTASVMSFWLTNGESAGAKTMRPALPTHLPAPLASDDHQPGAPAG